jgi:hypothetical protein
LSAHGAIGDLAPCRNGCTMPLHEASQRRHSRRYRRSRDRHPCSRADRTHGGYVARSTRRTGASRRHIVRAFLRCADLRPGTPRGHVQCTGCGQELLRGFGRRRGRERFRSRLRRGARCCTAVSTKRRKDDEAHLQPARRVHGPSQEGHWLRSVVKSKRTGANTADDCRHRHHHGHRCWLGLAVDCCRPCRQARLWPVLRANAAMELFRDRICDILLIGAVPQGRDVRLPRPCRTVASLIDVDHLARGS